MIYQSIHPTICISQIIHLLIYLSTHSTISLSTQPITFPPTFQQPPAQSTHLSMFPPIYFILSIHLDVFPPIYPSTHLSTHPPLYTAICPPKHIVVYPPSCSCIYQPIGPPNQLSTHPSIHISLNSSTIHLPDHFHLLIFLSTHYPSLPTHLINSFIYATVYLSTHSSIHLSTVSTVPTVSVTVCLYIHPSICLHSHLLIYPQYPPTVHVSHLSTVSIYPSNIYHFSTNPSFHPCAHISGLPYPSIYLPTLPSIVYHQLCRFILQ